MLLKADNPEWSANALKHARELYDMSSQVGVPRKHSKSGMPTVAPTRNMCSPASGGRCLCRPRCTCA